MKKLILIIQILIFTAMQTVHAADGAVDNQNGAVGVSQTEASQPIASQMPLDYRLPDMQLLDSVKFYNRYKDRQGKRLDVQGYTGRFGATFGEDFRKRIFEIEQSAGERIEIILTLSTTLADAKILKERMALVGRKMVIVEIPDEIQAKILAKAEAQAKGGFKELWWDTKDKFGKLVNIKETIDNSKKILKNQFVKPLKSDIKLVYISTGASVAATALLLTVGNVDPGLALTLGAMRTIVGGTSITYRRTIANLFRVNLVDELAIKSSTQQTLKRLTLMGLGLGEFYYFLGSHLAGPSYGMTQRQLLTNNYTSGLVETAASTERTNRLSVIADYRMAVYSTLISAGISAAAMVGKVGPILYDNGIMEISTLQTGALILYSGLFLAYRYRAHQVEKIAQKDLIQNAKEKYERLMNMRAAHRERMIKEKQQVLQNRAQLREALDYIRMRKTTNGLMCSRLFQ